MGKATVHQQAVEILVRAAEPEDGQIQDLQHPYARYFRHRLFTVYRRLFTIVFAANLIGFIWIGSQDTSPTASNSALLSTPIAANIFVAVLFRTDDFINLLYTSIIWVPLSLPLSIRRRLAKIYEFGGVHSGTSVAATFWTIIFAVQMARSFISDSRVTVPILTITWVILTMLFSIVIMAHPAIRVEHHNAFEHVHRFCGWISVILYWVLNVLLTASLAQDTTPDALARALFTSPTIYLLIGITLLLILPWARLRRIEVHATRTSSHATRLYFDSLKAQPTQTIRISTSPLLEWHSFAVIPYGAPYTSPNIFSTATTEPSALSPPGTANTSSSATTLTKGLHNKASAITLTNSLHNKASAITLADSLHNKASAATLTDGLHKQYNLKITDADAPFSDLNPPHPPSTSSSSPFSVIVSAAGDWTKGTISNPSATRTLWHRGRPTTGVTKAALLFRSAVIVTTGSGIGPALSLLMLLKARSLSSHRNNEDVDVEKGQKKGGRGNYRLIWSTPSPLATYGPQLLDEIHDADPEAVVWDTRVKGRPDLVKLAWGICKGHASEGRGYEEKVTEGRNEYEAVFVVSNQKVTEEVVYALEARKVPAFGPVFDS